MRRAPCMPLRWSPSVFPLCAPRNSRAVCSPRIISAALRSRPVLRCPVRRYATERGTHTPLESTAQADPKQLLFDFTPKPASGSTATGGPTEDQGTTSQKASGSTVKSDAAWPPRPEEEVVTITFTSPWIPAMLVLLLICAAELYTLDTVVKPDGERKLLAKVLKRLFAPIYLSYR